MAPKRSQRAQPADKKATKAGKDGKKNAETQRKSSKSEKTNSAKSGDSKMTLCTIPTVGGRSQMRERRPGRPPSGKRPAVTREMPAKVRSAFRCSLDPCDNSNDSGLGFDHHADPHHLNTLDRLSWNGERAETKRLKMDIKMENEDINDGRYCFPDTLRTSKDSTTLIRTAPVTSVPSLTMNGNSANPSNRAVPRCIPLSNRQSASSPISLTTQLTATSKYVSDVTLAIVKQPEQQHRARYQTEGSRGAVKDREGNGFPVVQLLGYYKPATLQVFIGTDVGKVAPHMFYQACKVSGKNSTPCVEKKIDGTCVIELQLDPSKEMSATCDCVGILKERNVDVEHRFPEQLGNRSKKKSTRCRIIFRTTLTHDDGLLETLQVCSQPIVCTQPPGIPEICKKSLTSCPASGGLELFVLGKNFLKDTKVYFQQFDDDRHVRWEQSVVPDKEYLQQTHFVCVIPPYRRTDITEPVTVRLCVVSSGKTSEPQQFVYTPVNGAIPSVHVSPPVTSNTPFSLWSKREQDLGMMPPPESSMVPMAPRRPSISLPSTSDIQCCQLQVGNTGDHSLSPPLRSLKQEYIDENSQSSVLDPIDNIERFRHISESSLDVHPGDSNMSMINDNSIDILAHNNNSNLSESSIDVMVRRSSNSMDMSLNNSTLTDDSSCNSVLQHCSSVGPALLLQQKLLHHEENAGAAVANDLKVIDLRMKLPMATVADLVNSSAPSMATLRSFGVTAELPQQSAQSVENFLTDMENKGQCCSMQVGNAADRILHNELHLKNDVSNKINQIITSQAFCSPKLQTCVSEPVFLSTQRPFVTGTTDNESLLVAKSEAAAIAEQTMEQTSLTTTMSSISTARLNQLFNSEKVTDSLMVTLPSPILNHELVSPHTSPILSHNLTSHTSPTLSPAVILSSQISPSLMCRTNQDALMPVSVETSTLLPANPNHSPIANPLSLVTSADPEKVVLLKAAVDLLETQKKISELDTRNKLDAKEPMVSKMMEDLITVNSYVQSPMLGSITPDSKTDFVIPVPVKEITGVAQVDKKTEDRMIPQSFTSLTENELINFINPSCFDQV